jgi:hypothetical protein
MKTKTVLGVLLLVAAVASLFMPTTSSIEESTTEIVFITLAEDMPLDEAGTNSLMDAAKGFVYDQINVITIPFYKRIYLKGIPVGTAIFGVVEFNKDAVYQAVYDVPHFTPRKTPYYE